MLHSAAQIFHAGIVVCRSAMRVQHTLGRTRVHDGMLQLPNTGSGFVIKAANSKFRRLQLGRDRTFVQLHAADNLQGCHTGLL